MYDTHRLYSPEPRYPDPKQYRYRDIPCWSQSAQSPQYQPYQLTQLRLSNLRKTDELVPPPTRADCGAEQVRSAFPNSHKMAGSQPRFWPAPGPGAEPLAPESASDPRYRMQTELGRPLHHELAGAPDPLAVVHKASEHGTREEVLYWTPRSARRALTWYAGDDYPQEYPRSAQQMYPTPPKLVLPNGYSNDFAARLQLAALPEEKQSAPTPVLMADSPVGSASARPLYPDLSVSERTGNTALNVNRLWRSYTTYQMSFGGSRAPPASAPSADPPVAPLPPNAPVSQTPRAASNTGPVVGPAPALTTDRPGTARVLYSPRELAGAPTTYRVDYSPSPRPVSPSPTTLFGPGVRVAPGAAAAGPAEGAPSALGSVPPLTLDNYDRKNENIPNLDAPLEQKTAYTWRSSPAFEGRSSPIAMTPESAFTARASSPMGANAGTNYGAGVGVPLCTCDTSAVQMGLVPCPLHGLLFPKWVQAPLTVERSLHSYDSYRSACPSLLPETAVRTEPLAVHSSSLSSSSAEGNGNGNWAGGASWSPNDAPEAHGLSSARPAAPLDVHPLTDRSIRPPDLGVLCANDQSSLRLRQRTEAPELTVPRPPSTLSHEHESAFKNELQRRVESGALPATGPHRAVTFETVMPLSHALNTSSIAPYRGAVAYGGYADADSVAVGGHTNTSAQLVPIGAVPDTSGQMGLASFRELKRELRATSRLLSAPPYALREADARPASGFKMQLSVDDLPGVRAQVLASHEAEKAAVGQLTRNTRMQAAATSMPQTARVQTAATPRPVAQPPVYPQYLGSDLLQLKNEWDRSAVRRQFVDRFPEEAPDLRENRWTEKKHYNYLEVLVPPQALMTRT